MIIKNFVTILSLKLSKNKMSYKLMQVESVSCKDNNTGNIPVIGQRW